MRTIFAPRRRRRRAAAGLTALALCAAFLVTSLAPAGADRGKVQPRRAGTTRVAIKDFTYRPQTLRIKHGTKVVFVNRDSAPHTATKRGSFDTGRLRKGRSAAVRFKRRGVYKYICTIHPFMRGKIVVR